MSQSSRGSIDARHTSSRISSPSAAEMTRPGPRSTLGALLAALPLVIVVAALFAPTVALGATVGLVVGVALVPAVLWVRRFLRRRRRSADRRPSLH